MAREDRFYAFIIAHTPHPVPEFAAFELKKDLSSYSLSSVALLLCGSLYGFYGLTQQATHFRTEVENQRLRMENERQRQELNELNHRVEAVEDTSRKLAEKSGVVDALLAGNWWPSASA